MPWLDLDPSDGGHQPQNNPHGPLCGQNGLYANFECLMPWQYCLAHPPTCDSCGEAQDPAACERQCITARINNKKACTQQYDICTAECIGTLTDGQNCDPFVSRFCCDGSLCDSTPVPGTSLVCGGGAGYCCIPYNAAALQVLPAGCTTLSECCTSDSQCCADGFAGVATSSCVIPPSASAGLCCGNGGACCTPGGSGGSGCCGDLQCKGPGPTGQDQKTYNSACSNTCCGPNGASCEVPTPGQPSNECCGFELVSPSEQQECDPLKLQCRIMPQGQCRAGNDECADGVPCTCPGAAPCVVGTCCAPSNQPCYVDADCCTGIHSDLNQVQVCDGASGSYAGPTGACRVPPQGVCDNTSTCAYGLPCNGGRCCVLAGNPAPSAGDCCQGLFWDFGSGTCVPDTLRFVAVTGNVIVQEQTSGAGTYNSARLQPLPKVPLFEPSVDIIAPFSLAPVDNQGRPGQQIEAHLFAGDLAVTNAALRSLGAAQPVALWDGLTSAAALGGDAILPYPPNLSWDLTQRYSVGALQSSYFWPPPATPPSSPTEAQIQFGVPAASSPEGYGSVKAVRMYEPGLCSFEYPFHASDGSGIFDQVSSQLWQQFSQGVDSPVNAYERVTALLDDGVGTFGPNGGFFLYFWFTGTKLAGLVDVQFAADYEYDVTLNDGRLAVTPTYLDLLAQPQDQYTTFRGALDNTLPSKLNQIATTLQRTLAIDRCDSDGGTTLAQGLLAGAAQQGGIGWISTTGSHAATGRV